MGNVFHPQTIATESPPIFNTKNITEGLFCADIIVGFFNKNNNFEFENKEKKYLFYSFT